MIQEQWFEAEKGRETVRALLQHFVSVAPEDAGLLSDLRQCLRVLTRAGEERVRFHLAVDF